MTNNEWNRRNRFLISLIKTHDNKILDRLSDYGLEYVTIGDFTDFIKTKLKISEDGLLSDQEIIDFIMDEANREALTGFGQLRNPIDTRELDAWQRENDMDREDRW